MPELALFEPQIPQNTGNIIRLCANTGFGLNLVSKIGFTLDNKKLLRAGLDYREFAEVKIFKTLADFLDAKSNVRIFAISTKGESYYHRTNFKLDDVFLFGAETHGLPQYYLDSLSKENILRIPMQAGSRSLNLANSCALVAFEAWRQLGFVNSV